MGSLRDLSDEEFFATIRKRRAKRMDHVDTMTPELRALVHEYGYCVVKAFLDHGVKRPVAIRHLIITTLGELSPVTGRHTLRAQSGSSQGPSPDHPNRREQ